MDPLIIILVVLFVLLCGVLYYYNVRCRVGCVCVNCQTDEDCEHNEFCLKGDCVTCLKNSDCGSDERCEEGKCYSTTLQWKEETEPSLYLISCGCNQNRFWKEVEIPENSGLLAKVLKQGAEKSAGTIAVYTGPANDFTSTEESSYKGVVSFKTLTPHDNLFTLDANDLSADKWPANNLHLEEWPAYVLINFP